jgi:hypothetical protein
MSGHSATRSGEYEIFEGKIVPPAIRRSPRRKWYGRAKSSDFVRETQASSISSFSAIDTQREESAFAACGKTGACAAINGVRQLPTDRSNDRNFIVAGAAET